ncbi:MAG: hypothetical protein ACJAYU_001152 [Bradymonadia bacterium]|jgi:hypothetical protein
MWPNSELWSAGTSGAVTLGNEIFHLSVVDCGALKIASGKLAACDPFVCLDGVGEGYVKVPKGEFPVTATIADVSGEDDGSLMREAYLTVRFNDAPEKTRKLLQMSADGTAANDLPDGEFYGFSVDAGTACLVDADAVAPGMPEDSLEWDETVFQPDDGGWFDRMEDEHHIREGIANLPLPRNPDEANIVICHSGWGDGVYPMVGGYDADGRLVAVHIDFLVVFDDEVPE